MLSRSRFTRSFFYAGIAACALVSTACGSSAKKGTSASVDAGGACGPSWEAECTSQHCDPADPAWSDCKINGWASYVAPPLCPVKSGMAGDDSALCVPSPEEGMQIHLGPSNYDDPDELATYTLAPSGESYDCAFEDTPAQSNLYVGQYVERSRPGAHHVQLTYAVAGDTTPSGTTRPCNLVTDLIETAGTFMAIAQTAELNVPDLSTPRPAGAPDVGGLDFEGSALPLPPSQSLQVLAHYLNTTEEPVLKEAWFNLYFRDPLQVTASLYGISLLGSGIKLPPHTTTTVRRSCQTDVDRSVKYLQGHSHVGSDRVSIWHAAAGGDAGPVETKVYESYDPLEPVDLAYNPFVTNPLPNPTSHAAGGASGPLLLKAGDSLVWECEFENDTDSTIGDGDPNPQAFGQMCYTYGSYAVPVGQPASLWLCGPSTQSTL